jgi:lysozyme
MNIKGLDISKYQGILDFEKLKANFDFVIIKATEGNGFTDTKFIRNQSESRRVDMLRGYYHFARPDLKNSATDEANWFLKTIGSLQEGEMLCLDYEANWSGDVVTWCNEFLDKIYSETKVKPLIYLNQALAKKYDWSSLINKGNGLWLAVYDYDADKPCPTTQWDFVAIKQYSNKLVYESLLVDGDIFYGDANAFKAYGYKTTNSDTNMTDDQTRALITLEKFRIEYKHSNLQGAIDSAIGAVKDLATKEEQILILTNKVNDLEVKITKINSELEKLNLNYIAKEKEVAKYQKAVETANTKIDEQKIIIDDLDRLAKDNKNLYLNKNDEFNAYKLEEKETLKVDIKKSLTLKELIALIINKIKPKK